MDAQAAQRVYKDLAEHYQRQGQPAMRDRFLVLAADAALAAGSAAEAERLRQRLLQVNPHHLLKPYKSFAEASQAPDVQTYVGDLRANYPPDTAENLLRDLRAEDLLNSLREEERAASAAKTRPVPTAPGAPPAEPPSVYRLHPEEPAPRRPGPAAEPQYQSVPRRASREPDAPKNPAQPATPAKTRRSPARPSPSQRQGPARGAWLASILFALFALACIALAAYILARPFLPSEWLR
jgi:hypothetical protein